MQSVEEKKLKAEMKKQEPIKPNSYMDKQEPIKSNSCMDIPCSPPVLLQAPRPPTWSSPPPTWSSPPPTWTPPPPPPPPTQTEIPTQPGDFPAWSTSTKNEQSPEPYTGSSPTAPTQPLGQSEKVISDPLPPALPQRQKKVAVKQQVGIVDCRQKQEGKDHM